MNRRPIGLGEASVALLLADRGEELLLQRGVGHLGRQRPAEPSGGKPLQCQPDRRRRHPTRRAISLIATPAVFKRSTSRTWRIAVLSAGIVPSHGKPKERTLSGPAETP